MISNTPFIDLLAKLAHGMNKNAINPAMCRVTFNFELPSDAVAFENVLKREALQHDGNNYVPPFFADDKVVNGLRLNIEWKKK